MGTPLPLIIPQNTQRNATGSAVLVRFAVMNSLQFLLQGLLVVRNVRNVNRIGPSAQGIETKLI